MQTGVVRCRLGSLVWARRAEIPLGQRRADPRGALQHRAPRAARREPGRSPSRHATDPKRRPPLARGCATTPACCSAPIARSPRRSARGARSRPPRSGCSTTSTSSKSRFARSATTCRRGFYRQLPKLADGPLRGLPARVRPRLGVRRAHRQPLRSDVAAPVRARLPARAAAHHRRALGRRDHAAHRARREPAPRGRADRAAVAGARTKADALADQLLGLGGRAAEPSRSALRRSSDASADGLRRCSSSAAARSGSARHSGARWLDERLAAQGTTADEIVRDEHQRQGGMNVTVRNVITSMRLDLRRSTGPSSSRASAWSTRRCARQ